ncbi:hypothetical protein [Sandaracinobacteroides saxicola]|uniref:Uncharacterized protein n=1 Tax=Sandaracinobacteroides saxicola TaxID=2759707 RepID=A0A7G5IJE0_9SPHN|nr:hypothetical protein [Sandaracinobacteroides saxicola]QMW23482.1 hypothetical protein H3309_02975 [Sandaracinobacteroides saxicola]
MSKQRKDAGFKVATALFETEKAIDGALAAAATMVGIMPAARQEARLAATIGQEAIDRAIDTVTALGEARRAIIAAHDALARVQAQVGLQEVNFGALVDKPPYPKFGLRVVETRAA